MPQPSQAAGRPEDDGLEAVPGFRTLSPTDPSRNPTPRDLDPAATLDPSTTSPPSPSSPTSPTRPIPPSASTSSTTSTDADGDDGGRQPPEISEELDEALAGLGAGAFHVAGVLVNKAAQRRSHTNTRLWLATEDEAQAFGDAMGRIAARRVPEELAGDTDGADILVMGATALGYVVRNGMGVDLDEAERIAAGIPADHSSPAPVPHSSEPEPVATPPRTMVQPAGQGPPPLAHYDTEPAAPAPPDFLSPDI